MWILCASVNVSFMRDLRHLFSHIISCTTGRAWAWAGWLVSASHLAATGGHETLHPKTQLARDLLEPCGKRLTKKSPRPCISTTDRDTGTVTSHFLRYGRCLPQARFWVLRKTLSGFYLSFRVPHRIEAKYAEGAYPLFLWSLSHSHW